MTNQFFVSDLACCSAKAANAVATRFFAARSGRLRASINPGLSLIAVQNCSAQLICLDMSVALSGAHSPFILSIDVPTSLIQTLHLGCIWFQHVRYCNLSPRPDCVQYHL